MSRMLNPRILRLVQVVVKVSLSLPMGAGPMLQDLAYWDQWVWMHSKSG